MKKNVEELTLTEVLLLMHDRNMKDGQSIISGEEYFYLKIEAEKRLKHFDLRTKSKADA
jgi:hypothetical protein